MTYILSTTPRIETIDDEPHMAQYALSDSAYGKTIGYMLLPVKDVAFWSKLLRATAERAWQEGYASGHSRAMRLMSDEPNVSAGINPYTVQQ
jgi:hypothetical protein